MAIALAVPVGRALVAAAPTAIDAVKSKAPGMWKAANDWYAKATNNAKADLSKAASNPSTVHWALEGLVRAGYRVADLSVHVPVITQEEATALRQRLLGIEADLNSRADGIAVGVVPGADAVEAAIVVKETKKMVRRAMNALGASNVQELRERLTAIRAISEKDLEAYEIDR